LVFFIGLEITFLKAFTEKALFAHLNLLKSALINFIFLFLSGLLLT